MTPEKQRIKIAEACGISIKEATDGWFDIWENGINRATGSSLEKCISYLPDYLNDLNAMHEAEKNLHHQGFRIVKIYAWLLNQVTSNTLHLWEQNEYGMCDNWEISLWDCGLTAHATATQRAEAFLRAMNLWEESP